MFLILASYRWKARASPPCVRPAVPCRLHERRAVQFVQEHREALGSALIKGIGRVPELIEAGGIDIFAVAQNPAAPGIASSDKGGLREF
jgi:hypothetical protein